MLSSTIKSGAFNAEVLKIGRYLIYAQTYLHKMYLKKFSPNHLRNCYRPFQVLSSIFVIRNYIIKIKLMVAIVLCQIYFTRVSKFLLFIFVYGT